jgi:hypothetical protein
MTLPRLLALACLALAACTDQSRPLPTEGGPSSPHTPWSPGPARGSGPAFSASGGPGPVVSASGRGLDGPRASHTPGSTTSHIPTNEFTPGWLVWQNRQTGERGFWNLTGPTSDAVYTSLGTVHTDWDIAAIADFSGDGRPDFLWQNTRTGERGFWFVDWDERPTAYMGIWNRPTLISAADYRPLATIPPEWDIAAAADFNQDGKADILWQNTRTGERGFWLMQGTNWDGAFLALPTVLPEWEIAAAADFNREGELESHPDILWQNRRTGQRGLWLMDRTRWDGAYRELLSVSPEWDMAGAGDVNADGRPDILWQDTVTGDRGYWFMQGLFYDGRFRMYLPRVNPEWEMVGHYARPGRALDASADRVIWMDSLKSGARVIRYFQRSTGYTRSVFSPPGASPDVARLFPGGMIFSIPGSPGTLYEERNGQFSSLGSIDSEARHGEDFLPLEVEGSWALWSTATQLMARDLASGTTHVIPGSPRRRGADVAANGDVVYLQLPPQGIWRYRNGVAEQVAPANDLNAHAEWVRTDGVNIIYLRLTPNIFGVPESSSLLIVRPGGDEYLTGGSLRMHGGRVNGVVNGGWAVYHYLEIGRRSPEGAKQQITSDGTQKYLEALAPSGEFLYTGGPHAFHDPYLPRYLVSHNATPLQVWTGQASDRAEWEAGRFVVTTRYGAYDVFP